MIPEAHYIAEPAHGNDFEFNRELVVIRRRAGKVEHVGALRSLSPTLDEQLAPQGVVYEAEEGGWWLVPEAHIAAAKKAAGKLKHLAPKKGG